MSKPFRHNLPHLKAARREQRNNPTSAELLLWQWLRKFGTGSKFRRQESIGPYIVDFYCPSARLIVEIDGGYHEDAAQQIMDQNRDKVLTDNGYKVLRFSNKQVISQGEAVIAAITEVLEQG